MLRPLRYLALALAIATALPLTAQQVCPGTPGQILWECWQGILDDELGELTAHPDYPHAPSLTKIRYRIEAPKNYDNLYGSRMRGFLSVDSTHQVTFNITGNQKAQFFLSTDEHPENITLVAEAPEFTEATEHNKYPEQTSSSITLSAGQQYYFEILHVENTYSDHLTLYWKTPLEDPNNWVVITSDYLTGVGCLPSACPPAGSSCDDGDPSTSDDQEDGHCHCFGTPTTANICVGERGIIEDFRYDSIPGGDLNDLYSHPNYPAMPQYSRHLDPFATPQLPQEDEMGDLVQAYLTVPVSGLYKFNITGDDQCVLFLSSDDDPANKQAHQAFVSGWTYPVEHNKFIWQSTGFISLNAGQYYYIEVNNKNGGGNKHFSIFWQTPFTTAEEWHRIPALYFYDYDCDIPCMPEGSPCDDGDPYTNDDAYDANCDCVGVPCSGPDCDSPLASYVPYDACDVTKELDNRTDNNWLSCSPQPNPNPLHPNSHWIQYDLGVKHRLISSQIWNYNVPGSTQFGFESATVDISLDGSTWTSVGTYNWPLANGDSNYSGFAGPDFMDVDARYILITSLDGTATCRGLGKVAFTAVVCPDQGVACDDGNPETILDKYNQDCLCIGESPYVNDCEVPTLVLGDSILQDKKYSAIQTVSSISTIAPESEVSFVAGEYVELNAGFETNGSTVFIAAIDSCDSQGQQEPQNLQGRWAQHQEEVQEAQRQGLTIEQNENGEQFTISFFLEKAGETELYIQEVGSNRRIYLLDAPLKNKGLYRKRLLSKRIQSGVYEIVLSAAEQSERVKWVL